MKALRENGNGKPIAIKIRVQSGCFHREHSPEAYKIIDEFLNQMTPDEVCFDMIEHENGPELIAWIALGTAELTFAKSVVDLITTIINARVKGREKGDKPDGKIILIFRDIHKTETSTEEVILEVYDKELVTSKQVETAIKKALNKK